jgi:EAL domain-containing protein (putative c-di-GMP-specific phosphodiesterase class I)
MNDHALEIARLDASLRVALERGEFFVQYQPKVNLQTGLLSGFEALLRWRHPEHGLVSPVKFIPLLERNGCIVSVGAWVVRTVCAQIAAWKAANLPLVPVAVNLSVRQFAQRGLVEMVGSTLLAAGVDAELLQFELTESLLMTDPEAAVATMARLKSAGIRFAVDDFGTGYSSLAYLKRLPLYALKIDRAFINDITTDKDDAIIVLAMINLSHSLNLKVVAEGVETREQLEFLQQHGCDEIQGYFFARPPRQVPRRRPHR